MKLNIRTLSFVCLIFFITTGTASAQNSSKCPNPLDGGAQKKIDVFDFAYKSWYNLIENKTEIVNCIRNYHDSIQMYFSWQGVGLSGPVDPDNFEFTSQEYYLSELKRENRTVWYTYGLIPDTYATWVPGKLVNATVAIRQEAELIHDIVVGPAVGDVPTANSAARILFPARRLPDYVDSHEKYIKYIENRDAQGLFALEIGLSSQAMMYTTDLVKFISYDITVTIDDRVRFNVTRPGAYGFRISDPILHFLLFKNNDPMAILYTPNESRDYKYLAAFEREPFSKTNLMIFQSMLEIVAMDRQNLVVSRTPISVIWSR